MDELIEAARIADELAAHKNRALRHREISEELTVLEDEHETHLARLREIRAAKAKLVLEMKTLGASNTQTDLTTDADLLG